MESALYHTQTQNQNNSSDSDVLVYLLELAVGETPSPNLEQELDDKGMGDEWKHADSSLICGS